MTARNAMPLSAMDHPFMLSLNMRSSISYILLLIPISMANRRFTTQCGESTTLNCLSHAENKTVNALWKKASGERVIWRYYSESNSGDTFKNRTKLNPDLSLSIDGCYRSDQGIYILCINGEQRCQVRLFVQASEKCTQPKASTGQSTIIPPFGTPAKQADTEKKHLETENRPLNTKNRCVVYIPGLLFVLVVLLLFILQCRLKNEKSKSDKTVSKLLHKDKQSNHAGVCF